jgi:nitrilase
MADVNLRPAPLDGSVTVAAVQVTPVFLDRDSTVELITAHIEKAASAGAQFVVLPEAIVPGYPDWVWRKAAWSDGELHEQLFDQAVDVPGTAINRLGAAARAARAWVAVGVTERVRSGTLYNTLVYLDPEGHIAARHRKLVATGGERTIWGHGDGSDLTVVDAGVVRLGGLICWENLMPRARAALYDQGLEVFLAPTWDNSDAWLATLRHIGREGRCYVVGTNTCLRASDLPDNLAEAKALYRGDDTWLSRGNTAIVGPDGDFIAGPLVGEAGMLVSTLDLRALRRARRQFDVSGHYARPDVFGRGMSPADLVVGGDASGGILDATRLGG